MLRNRPADNGDVAVREKDLVSLIDQHLDREYLVETLTTLAKAPTAVPLGFQTLMESDHPSLVHYVQNVLRPELVRLGVYDLIDVSRNNLIARSGTGASTPTLLIQNYTPAQHHNLMEDPFSGKIANAASYGCDEPCVFGQGVSQNKAHQAVMLTVMKLLQSLDIQLQGRLYWAVNNEGRSSHECSLAILNALEEKPQFGVLQIGTGLNVSLGNRGRLDVHVHVRGAVTHSSTPQDGLSAIEGAHEVIQRLKDLSWSESHPLLGERHAVVYQVQYEPVAPHTLPSDAYLTVDRRLLPGDSIEQATQEIREAIGDLSPYEVSVSAGVYMLPAIVEPDIPGVRSLQQSNVAVRGAEAQTQYARGTFDAGGPCSMGVPTVMYGASGGVGLIDTDFVAISAVETEARVLSHMVLDQLS